MLHSVVIVSYVLGAYAQTSTNTRFIGYKQVGNSYISAQCPADTATFATSGSYWGCSPYPAAGLGIATGCTSGTLLVGGTNEYTCVPGFICNTGLWFSDLNDQSPLSEYACASGGITSYYKSLPASVLATVTGVQSQTTATGSSSFLYTIGTSVYTVPIPALPTITPHSSSKAWIAGAVIGPVFGLALLVGIGVLIWALMRQKKKRQLAQQQPQQQQQPVAGFAGAVAAAPTEEHKGTWVFVPADQAATAPPHHQPAGSPPGWSPPRGAELPAQPPVSEVAGQRDPAELDSGSQNV